MTRKEEMLHELRQRGEPLCDDCVAERARFPWRQIANQLGRALAAERQSVRLPDQCADCGKLKIVNRVYRWTSAPLPAPETPLSREEAAERPWFWEGHVQERLAAWLKTQGYRVIQEAATESRARGQGILARAPDGAELWVTCKGYPLGTGSAKAPTQARHWLADALFEVARRRTARADVALAVALPDGFETYEALARCVGWLRTAAPFTLYWVSEDGSVREV